MFVVVSPDPVDNVEETVGSQRGDIVGCERLDFGSLVKNGNLRNDGDSLEPEGK